MKKLLPLLFIVLVVSLLIVSTATADPGTPQRGCKKGYVLQPLSRHLGESASLFLNPVSDTNGDGYVCAQYYLNGVHRHLDNFNRIRCKRR